MTRPGALHQRSNTRSCAPLSFTSHAGSSRHRARGSSRKDAAGVTVIATINEARVAIVKAAANGPKNFPCSPDRSSIGINTRTTTNVAYTTG